MRQFDELAPFASALAMLNADTYRDTLLTQQWTCTRCQSTADDHGGEAIERPSPEGEGFWVD